MKKTLIIIIVLIALAAIIWGVVAFLNRNKNGDNTSADGTNGGLYPITLPQVETSTLPMGSKIVIGTASGGVEMNNFYNTAKEINSERDALINKDDHFQFSYISNGESFIISILEEPIWENRQAAELSFLSNLGISQEQACKLTVSVGVPRWVSEEYSGRNLGLSFCR